jgi:hypothetical protein
MSVIITLIVYLIVLALVYWLVSLLPLPAPFGLIVRVLFVLLAILVVLSAFGIVDGGLPRVRLR